MRDQSATRAITSRSAAAVGGTLASAAAEVGALGSARAQAAPTPSPTLGENSPAPNPPGSANGSPQDYKGAVWIVVGVLVVAALIGGGTLYLARTRRIDLSARTSTDDGPGDQTAPDEPRTTSAQNPPANHPGAPNRGDR
ncbi:hypothetical protein GCM10009630_19320 [Kribbella jejuensis]|uniref:Uncharacterized protein n=1 Tax=Kribbella jejuensis TaxID=236068 RepID=A0A542ELM0_9ACTN|nr:hypothetical protein FB475_0192 [Kribbella jejuensis]